jgi:hypothetical protein
MNHVSNQAVHSFDWSVTVLAFVSHKQDKCNRHLLRVRKEQTASSNGVCYCSCYCYCCDGVRLCLCETGPLTFPLSMMEGECNHGEKAKTCPLPGLGVGANDSLKEIGSHIFVINRQSSDSKQNGSMLRHTSFFHIRCIMIK